MVRSLPLLLFLLVLGLSACAAPITRVETPPVEEPPLPRAPITANENLHSVLWTQTAIEYQATALQAYKLATIMLDRALADSSWTAGPEQGEMGGYEPLPPAVILDVDETVLDNSPYQARLVRDNAEYGSATWDAWVREQAAPPVPGAVDFTRYAAEHGVAVFYVTNRRANLEDATRANLAAYGFPFDPDEDRLLLRDEQPDWGADKATRRNAVGERHRILLLVGDNFGDFVSEVEVSVAARHALAERYADYWGTRWIMLPNPQYGSWEGALFDFDYSLSRDERLRRKAARLDTRQ